MEMSVDLTPNLISKVDATLEGEWKVRVECRRNPVCLG